MKKTLSAGVAAILAASLVLNPVLALADVAVFDESDLRNAIADTPDETIVVSNDITITEQITLAGGASVTLTDDGTPRVITATVPAFMVPEGAELTIAATEDENLTLAAGEGSSQRGAGNIATVDGGTLNLESGTVEAGAIDNPSNGAFYVTDGGTMNMSGGAIKDGVASTYYNAPIYVNGASELNISGGTISNNTGDAVGAVFALNSSADSSERGSINISGGVIENNRGGRDGAINVNGYIDLNISGGSILGNEGVRSGGAISLVRGAELTMTGGQIANNSGQRGGAVFMGSTRSSTIPTSATITGGTINNNVSATYGGAIYAIGAHDRIVLGNTLITGNEASYAGGGIWNCPTGSVAIIGSEGLAIFGNSVAEGGVGDDLAKSYRSSSVPIGHDGLALVLSERQLGGGRVAYYVDGGLMTAENTEQGEPMRRLVGDPDPSLARFDAANPGAQVREVDVTSFAALHAEVDVPSARRAEAAAHARIFGNSALVGGAIASNGQIEAFSTSYDLTVTKDWSDVPVEQRREVTVSLVIGGEVLDSIVLTSRTAGSPASPACPTPRTLWAASTCSRATAPLPRTAPSTWWSTPSMQPPTTRRSMTRGAPSPSP